MRGIWQAARAAWGVIALISIISLVACGGSSANTGIDLGKGPLLAFIGGDGNVWLAREDGSLAHAVTTTPCPATINCFGPPSWSPDGQTVAVFGPAASGTGAQIYFIDRQGLVTRTLAVARTGTFGPLPLLWSADGKLLAYQSQLKGAPPQLAMLTVDAASGAVHESIPLPAPSDVQCPDIASGGPLGSAIDRAINGQNGIRSTLDWSHDGSAFLVSIDSCQVQVAVIPRSGKAQLLTAAPNATIAQAAFAPDGQHLVAITSDGTQDALVLFDAHGLPNRTLLTEVAPPPTFAARLAAPIWSADGQSVVFMRGVAIWQIAVDGTNPRQLVAGNATGDPLQAAAAPLPAPDGKALAWVQITYTAADNTARTVLMVGSGDGSQPHTVAAGGLWPAWSVAIA